MITDHAFTGSGIYCRHRSEVVTKGAEGSLLITVECEHERSDHAVDRCVAKLGKPFHMHECGELVQYVAATPPEVPYSGWYHLDKTITDHHGVPEGMIR